MGPLSTQSGPHYCQGFATGTAGDMASKVEINREREGVLIDIKLSESRWFGAFSLVFAMVVAWSAVQACGHRATSVWDGAWASAPFFLFSVVLNLRIYGCAQKIFISEDHVDLYTMVGSIQIREERIPARAIERVELDERWVRMKGHRYLDRRIVLMSQDGVLARTTRLTVDDANLLLRGPLRLLGAASG